MKTPILALAAAEGLLTRALDLDDYSAQRLTRLQGKVVAVEVKGLALSAYAVLGMPLTLLAHYEGTPDLTLSGAPLALLRLIQGGGGFEADVRVSGDIQLASQLQAILHDLDIDWEEGLSRVIGDTAAHEAGNLWRGGTGYMGNLLHTLGLDLEEYLKEELRLLPQRFEVDEFVQAVDTLRDDADRLEARLRRLEARRADEPDSAAQGERKA